MAPVELDTNPSMLPALVFGSKSLLAFLTTALVSRSIYQSYLSLPPSSNTRDRQTRRNSHVKTFVLLAVTSFGLAHLFAFTYAFSSYKIWASEHGVELPTSFFGDKGALRPGEHSGRVHFVRWLNDTPLLQTALEVVVEKARYFWWGQQAQLGLTAWSHFLAIEGRRRKVPYLAAYVLLAQLVNLSFAQNMFFLAILLAPVPLPESTTTGILSYVEKVFPRKPDNWVPHISLYLTVLIATYSTTFLLPFALDTPSFPTITSALTYLPYAPLILPYLVPASWGKTHSTQPTYTTLFRTISLISTLLHLKSSSLALSLNTPSSSQYNPTLLHPLHQDHLSNPARAYTALERLFSAIFENPILHALGADVLLSGLSLGLWASLRGLDTTTMLTCSVPVLHPSISAAEAADAAAGEDPNPSDKAPGQAPTKPRTKTQQPTHADADYKPQPQTHDLTAQGDEIEDENLDVAALAWGIMAVGGLGAGSAGVLSAEVLA